MKSEETEAERLARLDKAASRLYTSGRRVGKTEALRRYAAKETERAEAERKRAEVTRKKAVK